LRFVVDECCHRLIASGLREAGHDIRYVAETDQRSSDEMIAALAIEEDRIVLTADYDFGELAVRHRTPMPGVVILAPTRQPIEQRVRHLVQVVSNLGEGLRGSLTIVEDERLRFRPLPPNEPVER